MCGGERGGKSETVGEGGMTGLQVIQINISLLLPVKRDNTEL